MSFVTHNQEDLDINGTHLQGYIKATYDELSALFGKPIDGDGYKVDAEWVIRFDTGTLATIYNWKDGPNYCGSEGTPVRQITEWHVGGESRASLDAVQITIDLRREQATEPKDALHEMIASREGMLASIAAQRGKGYADVVDVAYLVAKQVELFSIVLTSAVHRMDTPKVVADSLERVMSTLCANLLDKVTDIQGLVKTGDEAKELMAWVDRLIDAEQTGVEALVREARQAEKRK